MKPPQGVQAILRQAERLGFEQSCDEETGAFLRVLAASKPGGDILELGTGVGHSTAWLLAGMDPSAALTSVDTSVEAQRIARTLLDQDARVRFVLRDGGSFLEDCSESYDLIFADAWPGKFAHRERAISLLKPGGFYVIDDLHPRPDWPPGHKAAVDELIAALESAPRLDLSRLGASSGLLVACRRL